jgi:hypothetical protein
MTDPKEKAVPTVTTRTPKKKTPGIFDNLRKMPQPHPVEVMLGLVPEPTALTPSTPSSATTASRPSTPSTTTVHDSKVSQTVPIAPARDYTKVANSIVREAVPAGIFGGKSKQLYDYLYSLTRGAIVPRRSVRIPKDRLMKGSGIGSEVTLRTNLGKLSAAGLVVERVYAGTHGGNEYVVSLPEEAAQTGTTPPTPSSGSRDSSSSQFREGVEGAEGTPSSASLSGIESAGSSQGKTSFKTNTENNDDEAFARFTQIIQSAAKEITGKRVSVSEREKLGELAELLATELKIAAARTSNVSSIPAFLTEHLRRRLWKLDKKQVGEEGKPEIGTAESSIPAEQLRNCPDCGGSGLYYPGGYEKGVAKCRHEKLSAAEGT